MPWLEKILHLCLCYMLDKCSILKPFITYSSLSTPYISFYTLYLFLHLTTNFLNKLILHSFQFIICTNIPHRILDYQQKRNFPFFNKGFHDFCVKLCYKHYKKIDLQFFNFFFTLYGGQFTFSTQFLILNYL